PGAPMCSTGARWTFPNCCPPMGITRRPATCRSRRRSGSSRRRCSSGHDRRGPMNVEVNERTDTSARTDRTPLVKIVGVKKHFPITRGIIFQKKIGAVHAVDGVDLEVYPGETVGLVGETGCGKSTLARVIMKLYDPTEGQLFFDGQEYTKFSRSKMQPLRREMQMMFQDPYSSLNSRKTVGSI